MSERISRNAVWLAGASAIILTAIVLRMWGFSLESLDCDELFSYRVASAPVHQAVWMIRNDVVHPPLYYFLVRASLHAARHVSPLAIRAASLISGIGTVALVASFGFLFPQLRKAALLAACLLAFNDLHIYYSQQARSYAFYTLLFACLLAWSWLIVREFERLAFWCIGAALMSLLVYTHYVGALYVACIIVAITLSPVAKSAKFRAWIAGGIAALSFVPWILAEYGPAHQHHGVADNLPWETAPALYDLKAVWASYLGIPAFPAATTVVLLIGCALIAFGVLHRFREHSPFRRLFLTTLLVTAFAPPCVLFLVASKPISLPLFGDRHLLPSIISFLLLIAEGAVQFSSMFGHRRIALAGAAAILVLFEALPTEATTREEPRRIPFQEIADQTHQGLPLYTTWAYGIGATVNFYERGHNRVHNFPADAYDLPPDFLLIFRPGEPAEEQHYKRLLNLGWHDERDRDYHGSESGMVVRVAHLERFEQPAGMRFADTGD